MTKTLARRIRIGIVGVGKIARDQHLPAIRASELFELVATSSRRGPLDGYANYPNVASMIAGARDLHAVALCTPPQGRHFLARVAIEAGLHVLLEKPPGATVGEVRSLETLARERGITLFATWHSREAAGVEPARQWLVDREVRSVRVAWKEDVRFWHPGQEWIFEPGGLGVFDPAINALSILTRILPGRLILETATLHFPENRAAPIAAQLRFSHAGNAPVDVELDFLQSGPQTWDIEVETVAGQLRLSRGGAELAICGTPVVAARDAEYPRLYARFATLIASGTSDVDTTPLQHVADAFLLGRRIDTGPFNF